MKSRYVVSHEELVQMGMEGRNPCYLRELDSSLLGKLKRRKKDESK